MGLEALGLGEIVGERSGGCIFSSSEAGVWREAPALRLREF